MNRNITENLSNSGAPGAGMICEAIAIVGVSGRFPGARNIDEFWHNLRDGVESVRFFSDEELLAAGCDPELLRQPNYIKAKAMLDGAELFDAGFFGLNPREAEVIDPQHRLFLMEAWTALEHAGYDPQRFGGAIGVYAGLSMNTYLFNNLVPRPDLLRDVGTYQLMLANDKDFMPTRVSYKLNLRGPSVLVQTACSTSLVAVQLACQALLGYQCDLALAGGVSAYAQRQCGYLYQPGMILSPDGHCRAFDAQGRGIVAGEGVGLVVLKRLGEALADGDTIHAVIRGAAINNDGAMKVGYTAPSVDGQAEVVALALAMAGVAPETVSYIECHGTGTPLGDPIELGALSQVFRASATPQGSCAIGSVKTNIGHLDAAAGVAGLIKTVLALRHRQIPPSLHFTTPNPQIDFANSPFRVNDSLCDWTSPAGLPRRAGVSSFGIGGTNAHVVLEEAPPPPAPEPARAWSLLVQSARSPAALESLTDALAAHLHAHPEQALADVAWTLQVGRQPFTQRRVTLARTAQEAAAALESRDSGRVFSGTPVAGAPAIAFMFTGQGAQYAGMGRELYETEPLFRKIVDDCAGQLRPALGCDLREVLFPPPGQADTIAGAIDQTCLAQPALFTVEYALARQLEAWGIRPQAMIGHSIGEYVAACLAGVFTLEEALAVVAERGRLMQSMPPGAMLAVSLSERDLVGWLTPERTLAAVNAPSLCVVSGPFAAVESLQTELEARRVACRRLRTSHAYHSPMMEPALAPFQKLLERLSLRPPTIPFISNVTGTWIRPEEATDPGYWARHLRKAVRFADGLGELLHEPGRVLVEVGPGRTLLTLSRQHPSWPAGGVALSTAPHAGEAQADAAQHLAGALGRLWLAGAPMDWEAFNSLGRRRRVTLPTYPFECQRYWIDPPRAEASPAQPAPVEPLAKRPNLDEWFYTPSWKRTAPPEALMPAGRDEGRRNWLIFEDDCGLAEALAGRLARTGDGVVRVTSGTGFSHVGDDRYAIDPASPADYDKLLHELRKHGREPQCIIHAWNVTTDGADTSTDPLAACERAQRLGFFSLLHLVQTCDKTLPGRPMRLTVLANGMQEVVGEALRHPEKATLLGMIRTIPKEFPHLDARTIDVVWDADRPEERLLEHLLAEFETASVEQHIAYRHGLRWVQIYEPAPQPQAPEPVPQLKPRGVYLITGGLGGIGLTVADYFARTAQARLALVSRTVPPPRESWAGLLDSAAQATNGNRAVVEQIRALLAMEQAGGETFIVPADISDPAQVRAAVEAVRRHYGRIDGVFHAAGVAGGGLIQLKTPEQAARVLAPKVRGTMALEAALAGEPLDFFITCSSTSSIFGWIGQVDYCAANAFLDAFAAARQRSGGTRHVAINWDAWQEVGMAVKTETPAHLEAVKAWNLRNGITNAEGREVLGRILSRPLPQVIISTLDLPARLAQSRDIKLPGRAQAGERETQAAPTAAAAASRAPVADATHPRPSLPYPYAPPRGETETRLAGLWQGLLGLDRVGAQDNFFDLGGHSLLATQLISRLHEHFEVDLPMRAIFEAPTVAELSERIEALRWAGAGRQAAANLATAEGREEIEL